MSIEDFFKNDDGYVVFNPAPTYDGEWDFEITNLEKNSLQENNINLFKEFVNRTYTTYIRNCFGNASNDILKFDIKLVSKPNKDRLKGRCLYYSKKNFYYNLLNMFKQNLDIFRKDTNEYNKDLEELYNTLFVSEDAIKLAFTNKIKEKLNKIKELKEIELQSDYYNYAFKDFEILNESQETKIEFREYLNTLEIKYNDLLNGLIKLADFFDIEVDYKKLYKCFESEKFYLLFAKIIYENNIQYLQHSQSISENYEYLILYNEYVSRNNKNVTINYEYSNKKLIVYNNEMFKEEFKKLLEQYPQIKKIDLPNIKEDNLDKYRNIDLINKIKLLLETNFNINWIFTTKNSEICGTNEEVKERINLLLNTAYIFEPIKGINLFSDYIAFIYPNNKVLLEKITNIDNVFVPTYIMDIEDFINLNKYDNISIDDYIKKSNDNLIKRVFHNKNINKWYSQIKKEINEYIKYDFEDAITFINKITNEILKEGQNNE